MNNSVYSNGSAGHLCGVDQHGQQLPDPAPKQLQLGTMADFPMGKSWFNGYLCWANLDLQLRNFKIGLLPQLGFWRKKAPISSNPYADNAFAHIMKHTAKYGVWHSQCVCSFQNCPGNQTVQMHCSMIGGRHYFCWVHHRYTATISNPWICWWSRPRQCVWYIWDV